MGRQQKQPKKRNVKERNVKELLNANKEVERLIAPVEEVMKLTEERHETKVDFPRNNVLTHFDDSAFEKYNKNSRGDLRTQLIAERDRRNEQKLNSSSRELER